MNAWTLNLCYDNKGTNQFSIFASFRFPPFQGTSGFLLDCQMHSWKINALKQPPYKLKLEKLP